MNAQTSKKAHQQEVILSLLKRKKSLRTGEAARLLHVSECTVRRLFEELEQRGELIRVYGGANLVPGKRDLYYFENFQLHMTEQKERIGNYAGGLVNNGDLIYLDSGTTIQQMAIALAGRIRRGELRDIQVFTNSLRNLTILSEYCEINLIGGMFRSGRQDFCGYLSELVLDTVAFPKCFMGADGVSVNPRDGVMATDAFTAKISQQVVNRAGTVYLLADSSKCTRRSFIKYASLSDIYMLITDTGLSGELEQEIHAQGPLVIQL